MDYKIMIIYGLFLVVLYFFFILPNKKKRQKQVDYLADLKKGDKIVTTGGIHGKITELKDLTAIIDLGGGSKMKINRAAISMEAAALEEVVSSKDE
ncbi:preprotein translocase subunit YajC [Bacteroidia bacterium]|nr:preprotein translocase subunit YajC [Bacteroidia bacterium]